MFTVWDSVPLCPVTVTGGLPMGQSPKTSLSVDVAEPPEETVTLVGVNVVVTCETVDAERPTVPEKPPVLVTLIVMKCWEPALTVPRFEGLAVMVKSPVAFAGEIDGRAMASPIMIRLGSHLLIPIFMFDLLIVAS
jgi:hypothetical protein